jgi:hypothetical protein
MQSSRLGGIAIIVFAAAFLSFIALEMSRSTLGFEDADNPAVSMDFLSQHSNIYTLSGIASVVMAIALTVAVTSSTMAKPLAMTSSFEKTSMVFGLFSAAFFFGQGVLRVQAPGTLLHMEGLQRDWGLAGYLSVQMAGAQGFGSAGGFALSIWAVGICLANLWGRRFPLWLSVLGVAPATYLLVGLFGPLASFSDIVYMLYLGGIIGLLIWCLVYGIVQLRGDRPHDK